MRARATCAATPAISGKPKVLLALTHTEHPEPFSHGCFLRPRRACRLLLVQPVEFKHRHLPDRKDEVVPPFPDQSVYLGGPRDVKMAAGRFFHNLRRDVADLSPGPRAKRGDARHYAAGRSRSKAGQTRGHAGNVLRTADDGNGGSIPKFRASVDAAFGSERSTACLFGSSWETKHQAVAVASFGGVATSSGAAQPALLLSATPSNPSPS